jgi:uncharacterized membrane protein YtjA (UPF0391 family)
MTFRAETAVLTLAFAFLILALIAGVFSFVGAGPVGPILFVVFLGLFAWSLVLHRREQASKGRKTAARATNYTSAWSDTDRRGRR